MNNPAPIDLTSNWAGFVSLAIFALAYLMVIAEEFTHLRKSKPVMLAAGIIWAVIAYAYTDAGDKHQVEQAIRETLLEYAELLLFLLAAMTYVNAMTERNVFGALKSYLVRKGFGYRSLFWITGCLAFCLSPVIDNLTTALVLCAVVLAVGEGQPRFIGIACINIVVAANAGGAFSPFGDITTLMIWQREHVEFGQFFALFLPSLVNFLVPAIGLHFAIPQGRPAAEAEGVTLKRGGGPVIVLFVLTLLTAIGFHNLLHIPAFLGMMTGLAYLNLYGYYLKQRTDVLPATQKYGLIGEVPPFNVFDYVARAEWDTLLFFFGVIMCVGGLGQIGYLELASELMYEDLGPTRANILVGLISALIDNIPVVVAVLHMNPEMSVHQWLLITLTAGVGGSMLSVGSAAGVALMGQARGYYTFVTHLRYTPLIAMGYAASIAVHLAIN